MCFCIQTQQQSRMVAYYPMQPNGCPQKRLSPLFVDIIEQQQLTIADLLSSLLDLLLSVQRFSLMASCRFTVHGEQKIAALQIYPPLSSWPLLILKSSPLNADTVAAFCSQQRIRHLHSAVSFAACKTLCSTLLISVSCFHRQLLCSLHTHGCSNLPRTDLLQRLFVGQSLSLVFLSAPVESNTNSPRSSY